MCGRGGREEWVGGGGGEVGPVAQGPEGMLSAAYQREIILVEKERHLGGLRWLSYRYQ